MGWLLLSLLIFVGACGPEELVEPSVYVPKQIRRLLTADASKLWQQTSRYYLEEECRTGYYVEFSENKTKDIKKPFLAYFYRDTDRCEPPQDTVFFNDGSYLLIPQEPFLLKNVSALTNPALKTTDTLMFIGPKSDSTWYHHPEVEGDSALFISPQPDTTIRLVRLLTNQLLIFDVLGPDYQPLYQETFQAVPAEE